MAHLCVTFILKSQFFRRLLSELSLSLASNMLITIYFVILDWNRDYVVSGNLMADFIIPVIVINKRDPERRLQDARLLTRMLVSAIKEFCS